MAVNQHVNKVILNGTTLMDVSGNTITDEDMMEGVTATMPDGSTKTGKMRLDDIEDLLSGISTAIEGISGGGSPAGIRLANVSDTSITGVFGTGITISWMDPDDAVTDPSDTGGAATLAEWAGTKLVRKPNSAPLSPTDGVVIVDNKIRGQYAVNGYIDNSIEFNVTYYYRFFPYTIDGVYTTGSYVSSVVTTPSWITSDDNNVIAAIQMADRGEIDLYEDLGWRVGDVRPIGYTTSYGPNNQIVGATLVNRGSNFRKLVTPRTKKDGTTTTEPNFVVAYGKFYSPYHANSGKNVFPQLTISYNRSRLVDSLWSKLKNDGSENVFLNMVTADQDVYISGFGSSNDITTSPTDMTSNRGIPTFIKNVAKQHLPGHLMVLYSYNTQASYNSGVTNYTSLRLVNPSHIKYNTLDSESNKYSLPSALELGYGLPSISELSNTSYASYGARLKVDNRYTNGDFLIEDTGFGQSEYEALNSNINDYKWSYISDKNVYNMTGYLAQKNTYGAQTLDYEGTYYAPFAIIDVLSLYHSQLKFKASGYEYYKFDSGISFQSMISRKDSNTDVTSMYYDYYFNKSSGRCVSRSITTTEELRIMSMPSGLTTKSPFDEGSTTVTDTYKTDEDNELLVFCI